MTTGYLYHGTPCKNVRSICEQGILKGTRSSCSKYSRESGFAEDCVGNVSLAVDKQDARFFCVATKECYSKLEPQCIIKVRTDKLDHKKIEFRDLFGKNSGEAKYYDDVPVEAIENVQVRSRTKQADGTIKWVTKVRKCPVNDF
jgi:hypothetical protein